jgi:hypothetical protein
MIRVTNNQYEMTARQQSGLCCDQTIGGRNGGELNLHKGASLAASGCRAAGLKKALNKEILTALRPGGQVPQ